MNVPANFDTLFNKNRIMVVLRGCPAREAVRLAKRAWDIGIELVEVPLGDPSQLQALEAVVAIAADRHKAVGAGTVISRDRIDDAGVAGARYTVAPGYDPDVLAASLSAGLPHLPGVATPTQVQDAYRAGCTWVKVFPASSLGPGWVAALRGPFPDVRQVVTGGVSIDAARDYLAAGAQMVAFGVHVLDQVDHLSDLVHDARAL